MSPLFIVSQRVGCVPTLYAYIKTVRSDFFLYRMHALFKSRTLKSCGVMTVFLLHKGLKKKLIIGCLSQNGRQFVTPGDIVCAF